MEGLSPLERLPEDVLCHIMNKVIEDPYCKTPSSVLLNFRWNTDDWDLSHHAFLAVKVASKTLDKRLRIYYKRTRRDLGGAFGALRIWQVGYYLQRNIKLKIPPRLRKMEGFIVDKVDLDKYNNISQPCPCGTGWCRRKTSNSAKNPGREYWSHPAKSERSKNSNGCGFFMWVDEPDSFEAQVAQIHKRRKTTTSTADGTAFPAGEIPDQIKLELNKIRLQVAELEGKMVVMDQHVTEMAMNISNQ